MKMWHYAALAIGALVVLPKLAKGTTAAPPEQQYAGTTWPGEEPPEQTAMTTKPEVIVTTPSLTEEPQPTTPALPPSVKQYPVKIISAAIAYGCEPALARDLPEPVGTRRIDKLAPGVYRATYSDEGGYCYVYEPGT